MRRLIVGTVTMFAVAAAMAVSWETSSFRTASGELVRVGMINVDVINSAGQPLDRSVISQGLTINGQAGLTREIWTYRTGDGTYTLTFTGTRLEKIEVTPSR